MKTQPSPHPDMRIDSIGIDVSKAKLDIVILRSDRSCYHLQTANDGGGIRKIIQKLKTQGTNAQAVPCVLESTGDFHLLVALTLAKEQFQVKCINPLISKKYQRSDIRSSKTDKIDAKRLAEIGLLMPGLPLFTDTPQSILKRKALSLLSKLETTRQQLVAAQSQCVTTQKQLGVKFSVTGLNRAIGCLERQMESLEVFVTEQAPQEAGILAQLPGITKTRISLLLAGLSGKEFKNRDQLIAFVGLDVKQRKSGAWQGREKLSKRGNGYLRKLLYHIAWGLTRYHADFKQYFEKKYLQEKHHYKTAMMAAARKFLRFLFAFYWKKSIALSQLSTTAI
jgi:transposase